MQKVKKRKKRAIKKKLTTSKKPKVLKKRAIKKPKVKKRKKTSKKPIWALHVEKMQKRIDKALKKLKRDIKNNASYKTIEQDNNELLMILGECNYIVREFHRNMRK